MVVDYSKQKFKVGYGAESSHATGGTPTTPIQGFVQNITSTEDNTTVQDWELGDRNQVSTAFGDFRASGTVNFTLGYGFDFFQHLIGGVTGSGTTAAPYLLNEDDVGYISNNVKTFELEYSQDTSTDYVTQLEGCIITDTTLTGAIGTRVNVVANFLASSVAHPASASAITSFSGELPIMQEGDIEWEGSSIARLQSFVLSVNNSASEIREVGSRFNVGYSFGQRIYNFTVVVNMTDTMATTLRANMYGGSTPSTGVGAITEYTFKLILSQGSVTNDENIEVLLSNCTLTTMSSPIPIGTGVVQTTFTGFARQGTSNKPFSWWTAT